MCCLKDAKNNDFKAFNRHFSIFKSFISDIEKLDLVSIKIYSMYLLFLLVNSKISCFHIELEKISLNHFRNENIKFILEIEHFLTIGKYDKILNISPHKDYENIIQCLKKTVRNDILNCIEKSYKQISTEKAKFLLQIKNEKKFNEMIKNKNWKIDNNFILFYSEKKKDYLANEKKIIIQLDYINEIEKII